jgi:hypothetical protein
METNLSPVTGDTATLESLLNAASWEVGICIVPHCEPCDSDANDESEVR